MDRISLKSPINQFTLLRQMLMNSLSLGYYGHFSDSVNDALIPLAEDFIGFSNVPLKIRKRAFFIFVECIQNVNRHHFKRSNQNPHTKELFLIRELHDRFNIALGNVMKKDETKSLRSKIDKLNSLSIDALNTHYKLILEENILTNRGGAGLGLIEVARKSGSRMSYQFEERDTNCSFFSMDTNINERDSGLEFPTYEGVKDIGQLKKFYKDHDMGLIMINDRQFFTQEALNKVFYSLNSIGPRAFFNNSLSSEHLFALFQALGILESKEEDSNNNLALHFNHQDQKKSLYVAWSNSESMELLKIQNALTLHHEINNFGSNPEERTSINVFVEAEGSHTHILKIPIRNSN